MVLRISAPVAARVHQREHAEDDQGGDGHEHVPERAVRIGVGRLGGGRSGGRRELFPLGGALLALAHRAEVEVGHDDEDDEQQAEQRVEVPGNRGDERGHVAFEGRGALQ